MTSSNINGRREHGFSNVRQISNSHTKPLSSAIPRKRSFQASHGTRSRSSLLSSNHRPPDPGEVIIIDDSDDIVELKQNSGWGKNRASWGERKTTTDTPSCEENDVTFTPSPSAMPSNRGWGSSTRSMSQKPSSSASNSTGWGNKQQSSSSSSERNAYVAKNDNRWGRSSSSTSGWG
eukprot:11823747-Ditylum_brightwellii.AAC.1